MYIPENIQEILNNNAIDAKSGSFTSEELRNLILSENDATDLIEDKESKLYEFVRNEQHIILNNASARGPMFIDANAITATKIDANAITADENYFKSNRMGFIKMKITITEEGLFDSILVDAEISRVNTEFTDADGKLEGFSGDISLERKDTGWTTISGEHGVNDYTEYGFIIEQENEH